MPRTRGLRGRFELDLETYYKHSKSVVRIKNHNPDTNLSSAVTTALIKFQNNQADSKLILRQDTNAKFQLKQRTLNDQFKVRFGHDPITLGDYQMFLGPEYQLISWDVRDLRDLEDTVIEYKGPIFSPNQLYFLRGGDGLYNVMTKPAAFFGYKYFCIRCLETGWNIKSHHCESMCD